MINYTLNWAGLCI